MSMFVFFFFSSRRRHRRCSRDWSSDVCSSDLPPDGVERLENLLHERPSHGIPLAADGPRIFERHAGLALDRLFQDRTDGEQDIAGLEAGDGAGDTVVPGDELIRLRADNGADVARIDEAWGGDC